MKVKLLSIAGRSHHAIARAAGSNSDKEAIAVGYTKPTVISGGGSAGPVDAIRGSHHAIAYAPFADSDKETVAVG